MHKKKSTMKVLHLSTTDSNGGAAIAAYRLMEGLVSQSVDVKMLVLNKTTDNPLVIKVEDIRNKNRVFRFIKDITRKLNFYYKSYRWAQYSKKRDIALDDVYVSYLEDCLERLEFDILHLHWVEGGFINFKELQTIDKPIVWTIHGSFPFTGICHHMICDKYKTKCGTCPALGSDSTEDFSTQNFNLKKKRYEKLNLHIISPSNFLAIHAKNSTLLGKKPIHVIPNGLNIEVFKPHNKLLAKKTLNIKDKKTIVFGAVGATSDKNKGFDLLLASLSKLESYYEQDKIQLIIFGGDFKNETHFEVINLGFINDTNYLSMLYSAADVMVVPSKHENLPYTFMERLSCGTPVVAFNVGGNSDMIDHKQNGYLANPYDIKDFTEGIYWCIENAANEKPNIQSRQKVLHNFPIEKIATQHIDLYKSLLK